MSNVLQQIEANQPVIGRKVTFQNPTRGGDMPSEMNNCQMIGEITKVYQLHCNPDPDYQGPPEWFVGLRNISHNYSPFHESCGLPAERCRFATGTETIKQPKVN